MSKNDQKQFLKLQHSNMNVQRYVEEKLRSIVGQMYGTGPNSDKISSKLKILSNFISNASKADEREDSSTRMFGIHAASFNHSCRPNTSLVSPENSYEYFVRTITKIKAGEEITLCYNYSLCAMKSKETRQKIIQDPGENYFGFICACNDCKFGTEDKDDIEAFEKFQKWKEEAKSPEELEEMLANFDTNAAMRRETISYLRKQIGLYKDMYNLGKKKKASVYFLYGDILLAGMMTAAIGCMFMAKLDFQKIRDEFKSEYEVFSKAAKAIDEMLGTTTEERFQWQKTQNYFEKILAIWNR